MNKNGIGDTLWKNPMTGQNNLRAVKALVRATLIKNKQVDHHKAHAKCISSAALVVFLCLTVVAWDPVLRR